MRYSNLKTLPSILNVLFVRSLLFFQFDLKKYEAVACNNQLLNRLKILPAYFEHTFYLALSESEAYLPCRTPRW